MKKYLYHFRSYDCISKINTIDVRKITKEELDFLLNIIKYYEFKDDINYRSAKQLLTDHFPELLI